MDKIIETPTEVRFGVPRKISAPYSIVSLGIWILVTPGNRIENWEMDLVTITERLLSWEAVNTAS